MTNEEIVKALRCCAKGLGHDDACENCKVGEIQDRREYIEFAAASLIEQLRREIERKDSVIDCTQKEVWERLKAYEDAGLSPQACAEAREIEETLSGWDYSISRMVELMKADVEGRVVVLPCKVGDTVWALIGTSKDLRECVAEFVNIGYGYTTIALRTADSAREQYGVPLPGFGRTVFLTREEAEKALEARKDD